MSRLAPDIGIGGAGGDLVLPGVTSEEFDVDHAKHFGQAMLFREWLKEIDSRLDLVWAKSGAVNLTGNRWYIVRRNDGFANTYWVVQSPDGGFAHPGPEHIEMLKRMDTTRHPGAWARHLKQEDERRRRGEKLRAERHREFAERLDERVRHLADATVSLNGISIPVTQSAGGVVLPSHLEEVALAATARAERAKTAAAAAPEAFIDDAIAGGGVDDFKVETVEAGVVPNRAMRRAKRNKALTKPRDSRVR